MEIRAEKILPNYTGASDQGFSETTRKEKKKTKTKITARVWLVSGTLKLSRLAPESCVCQQETVATVTELLDC